MMMVISLSMVPLCTFNTSVSVPSSRLSWGTSNVSEMPYSPTGTAAELGKPSKSSFKVASEPGAAIKSNGKGNSEDTAQGRLMVMVAGPQSSQAQ